LENEKAARRRMEALGLPAAMPRVALKLATAFFGHGEAQRVINLSRFDNPDSCPFWTVRRARQLKDPDSGSKNHSSKINSANHPADTITLLA
jgi:hypothetical protein